MKQTIKTSRVAGQLEKMFRLLNNHFFDAALPEVVISLKKTVGAYGHFTCGKVWQAGDERRYEINISSATLNRPIEETCATLLHEMCHLAQLVTAQKSSTRTATPNPSRTPAITACITTKDLSRWPRRTGWKWSTTPNMVGQLPAPELTCWISSKRRGGRTYKWLRAFHFLTFSVRSPKAGAEPKSPVVPASTFAPNAVIAAERQRQST